MVTITWGHDPSLGIWDGWSQQPWAVGAHGVKGQLQWHCEACPGLRWKILERIWWGRLSCGFLEEETPVVCGGEQVTLVR